VAKHILYNASVNLNGVDLSDHDNKIEFTVEINGQAAAAMSEIEDYEMPGTRKVSPISAEFYQDYAASKVYQTLMTLWTNRTTFNAILKADAGANATTNPAFTVPVFIKSMPVISGSRGDAHKTTVTLQPAGLMTIATV
jgi:hypothetical protein